MGNRTLVAVAAVLSFGFGFALSSRALHEATNSKQIDAAYRDGSFLAELDVAGGRKAHLSSGRWNFDEDRSSFIAGYNQTYRGLSAKRSHKTAELTSAELAGYRDGILDGLRHRKTAQPFQVSKTDKYRTAGRDYREAYSNGYQEGYYSKLEAADVNTISQKLQSF